MTGLNTLYKHDVLIMLTEFVLHTLFINPCLYWGFGQWQRRPGQSEKTLEPPLDRTTIHIYIPRLVGGVAPDTALWLESSCFLDLKRPLIKFLTKEPLFLTFTAFFLLFPLQNIKTGVKSQLKQEK